MLKTSGKWRSLNAKAELSEVPLLSNYAQLSTRKAMPESLCLISRKCLPWRAEV